MAWGRGGEGGYCGLLLSGEGGVGIVQEWGGVGYLPLVKKAQQW